MSIGISNGVDSKHRRCWIRLDEYDEEFVERKSVDLSS
jgi:hypothetical protein